MLGTSPRQRAAQPPRRVQFLNDKLDELQVLRVGEVWFGEHSLQFNFRGSAVE